MARWESVSIVATAIALVVLPVPGVLADEIAEQTVLLRLDGPKVDIKVLAQESLHGQGLPAQGIFSGPVQFGVILWDEVKPGQPPPPSQPQNSTGQGRSNLNGTLR
jgi:hypothetical protein